MAGREVHQTPGPDSAGLIVVSTVPCHSFPLLTSKNCFPRRFQLPISEGLLSVPERYWVIGLGSIRAGTSSIFVLTDKPID